MFLYILYMHFDIKSVDLQQQNYNSATFDTFDVFL